MAIKASVTITISCYRDTQSITRYYKLQASTAAVPTKPTENPPTGWTDTEPSYTSGSTNTLYFCDLTVFSNGEWSCSNVSVSSSYEAAKEAYNKAVAAQNAANNAREDLTKEITAQSTKVLADAEGIFMSTLEEYVQKGTYEEYKTQTETQMSVLKDSVVIEIEDVTKSVNQLREEVIESSEKMQYQFGTEEFEVNKSGSEMSTHISEDGMRVKKNTNDVLVANSSGVEATNLHAKTYLIVGNNSRFEDYNTNRTGCFWIGN